MEDIIFTTHWRFGAGVCVLSVGLLIGAGGGAIALAEPESGGGAGQSQGGDGGSKGASSTNQSGGSGAGNQNQNSQGVTGTSGSGSSAGQSQSDSSNSTTTPSATNTTDDDEKASKPVESASDAAGSASEESQESNDAAEATTTSTPGTAAPEEGDVASGEAGSGSGDAAGQSGSDSSGSDTVASTAASGSSTTGGASTPGISMAERNAQFWSAVAPVTDAMTTITHAVGSVPATVAALPTSETPITDVITAVQDMLTTVAGAVVPVSQVPSNLYSLLGVPPNPEAVAGVGGGATVFASSVDAEAPRPAVAHWAPVAPTSEIFGGSLDEVAAPATLGTIAATGLSRDLNLAGMAPVRPEAVAPAGARSFLDHVVSAVLVPASLSALAALALPGVGGLLIIMGAGMRVGYRQAKAALVLRASGVARYAGPGPLGVVRSGSLVALHVRPPRPVEPEVSRPSRILERVA